MPDRLSLATLGRVPGAVARPAYDPAAVRAALARATGHPQEA